MSHQSQPPHVDYQALADLRYQVRRFLRTREVAARAAGVAPQQYVLLLQVKGLDGREPPTIRALAERLQTQHHAVVQLVDRLAARDMVARRRDVRDRREVLVELRPAGEAVLRRLAGPSGAGLRGGGAGLLAGLAPLVWRTAGGGGPRRAAPERG